MPVDNLSEIPLSSLGKAIVSVLGGKIYTTPDKAGFVLERLNRIHNIYHRLEVKKILLGKTSDTAIFSLDSDTGTIEPRQQTSHYKILNLSNLQVTRPNIIAREEKKITFLANENNEITLVEVDANFKLTITQMVTQ